VRSNEREFIETLLEEFLSSETPLPADAEWETLAGEETLSDVGRAQVFGTLFGILVMVRGNQQRQAGMEELQLDEDDIRELRELIDEREAEIAQNLF
jgi:hypothetical protein